MRVKLFLLAVLFTMSYCVSNHKHEEKNDSLPKVQFTKPKEQKIVDQIYEELIENKDSIYFEPIFDSLGRVVDVHLENLKSDTLPTFLSRFKSLYRIGLKYYSHPRIPKLDDFPQVKGLLLVAPEIQDTLFLDIENVENLTISFSTISKIKVINAEKLEDLYIFATNLNEIDEEFTKLKNLKFLYVPDNKITKIDTTLLSKIPKLERINLGNNIINDTTVFNTIRKMGIYLYYD